MTPATATSTSVGASVPPLAHRRHTVSATYLGDSTFRGSTGQIVQVLN